MKLEGVEFVALADRFLTNSWNSDNFKRRWRKLSPMQQALLANHQEWIKNRAEIDLGSFYAHANPRSLFYQNYGPLTKGQIEEKRKTALARLGLRWPHMEPEYERIWRESNREEQANRTPGTQPLDPEVLNSALGSN